MEYVAYNREINLYYYEKEGSNGVFYSLLNYSNNFEYLKVVVCCVNELLLFVWTTMHPCYIRTFPPFPPSPSPLINTLLTPCLQ